MSTDQNNQAVKIIIAGQAGSNIGTIADTIAGQMRMFGLPVLHEHDRESDTALVQLTRMSLAGQAGLQVEIVEDQMPRSAKVSLLSKTYDGESIVDMEQDVSEAFTFSGLPDDAIPVDEFGIPKGIFKLSLTWEPGE